MDNHKVLWLITARSGSKGIPDKNIKPLGGLPLLAYRIKSILTIADKEDLWISTDSIEYAKVAEGFGANVPFIRPSELASDTSRSEDVVIHAMKWAESLGRTYETIALLQPTSPFIKPKFLLEAVNNLMREEDSESIVAVREVKPNSFYVQEEDKYLTVLAERIASRGTRRRQDEKKQVTPSGGFFISKWDAFKKNRTFYPMKTLAYLVPDIFGLDIDEPLDWLWAEMLLEKNILKESDLFTLE